MNGVLNSLASRLSAKPSDTSPVLDLDACRRVAAVGSGGKHNAVLLKQGRLGMYPHPTWDLPAPDKIDWSANPFQDRNWRFQFHALRWLDPLRVAAEDGDDEALQLWLAYVWSWAEHNPMPAGREQSYAWLDMQDGLRAIHLVAAAPVVAERAPSELPRLAALIETHGQWLANPRNIKHSNHALHQHQGFVTVAAALRRQDWIELAARRLRGLFYDNWDEEGMNAEGATAYHSNNLHWWRKAVQRFAEAGVDVQYIQDRLRDADAIVAHATRPDGTLVMIGNTDPQNPYPSSHPYIEWVSTNGQRGAHPTETVKVYRAGYIYGRSGWGDDKRAFSDATFFSLTFGYYKIHGHHDGGSLTFSTGNVNWVTDLGKYSYQHDCEIREHIIHHDSHSLTYIEGRERNIHVPVRLLQHKQNPDSHEFLLLDNGYRGVRITRRVIYFTHGEHLMVIDDVHSKTPVDAVQRWQLGAGVEVVEEGQKATLRSQGRTAHIECTSPGAQMRITRYQEGVTDAFVSTGWKKLEPASVVTFRQSGTHLQFVTIIASDRRHEPSTRFAPQQEYSPLEYGLTIARQAFTALVRGDRRRRRKAGLPSRRLGAALKKQIRALRARERSLNSSSAQDGPPPYPRPYRRARKG